MLWHRRILADDQSSAAMGIDVVGAILGVVLQDEDGCVVPVRAVRYGVNHSANGQVIVSDRCGGTRLAFRSAGGVVVRQSQEDELRQRVLTGFARGQKSVELVQELIGAK